MDNAIVNIHDKFFKIIMSDLGVVRDFIIALIDPSLHDKLDLDSLRIEAESFISDTLKTSFADAVFHCRLKGQEQECFICILLEHKSKIDRSTSIQVLNYLTDAYQSQWKNNLLVPIIPVVFYHGDSRWEYESFSSHFKTYTPEFTQYVPKHHTVFIDLSIISDELLQSLSNTFLASAHFLQKHSKNPIYLENQIETIFKSLDLDKNRNLLKPLIVYLLEITEIAENRLIEIITPLSSKIKSDIMSTYEQILEKGIEQGKQDKLIEIVLNAYASGISKDMIVNITGADINDIEKIIQSSQC